MKESLQQYALPIVAVATSPLWLTMLYKISLELWCVAYGLIY